MRLIHAWAQMHGLTGSQFMAFTENSDDLALAEPQGNQCFRSGRLDDGDPGRNAVLRQIQMLWPNAVYDRLAIGHMMVLCQRQYDALGLH